MVTLEGKTPGQGEIGLLPSATPLKMALLSPLEGTGGVPGRKTEMAYGPIAEGATIAPKTLEWRRSSVRRRITGIDGGTVTLERTCRNGDTATYELPMEAITKHWEVMEP